MDINEALPVWRKICFAMGGPCFTTTHTVISFFISVFLLEVAQIRPLHVSIIMITDKVWDAITDPVCGFLVNKTNTRFGKFRPWILFSAPFACGTYFCMWYVPDVTYNVKFAWYIMFYCLCKGFVTALYVPHSALTMALSHNQKERDSATAYRLMFENLGTLVAVVVQGQIVNKYRRAGTCGPANVSISLEVSDGEKWSYELGAIIIAGLYMVCSWAVFFGVKEKRVATTGASILFLDGFRDVLTFKPYLKLSLAALFNYLAIAVIQGNLALFCTHSLHLGAHFANFILVLLITAICALPLWQKCLVKFGKKSTFAAGLIGFLPPVTANLFVGDNLYVYYAVTAAGGMAVSALTLLPWSMLPDVLDEFYLKTGKRKDALFYSFFVFFLKLASGMGLGLSQAALAFGGYKTGACNQPESVGLTLRLLVGPGPILFFLLSLLFLYLYPINEERRQHNRKELELRYKSVSARESDMPPLLEEIGPVPDSTGSPGKASSNV